MLKRWSLAGLMLIAAGCGSQVDGTDVDNNGGPGGDGGATGGALNGGGTAGPTNGTGGTGATAGGNSTGIDDDGKCEEFVAQAKPTTPDMLIVLDRSGSMKRDGTNRWDPSVSALKAVTSMLDDKIRFGMMMFPKACPANDPICTLTSPACATGALEVPIAIGAGDMIATRLDATSPNGGTPTGATLNEALTILKPEVAGPDVVTTPKYVLLVTDGQPTCPSGGGSALATAQQLADDKKLTLDAIDALLTAGAKTYVIGYDADLDPALSGALTEFAMHGGTKDYRPVQDEQSLLTEFEKITGEVVSCSYELDMVPPDPKTVLVKLDGKQLNLKQADGWSIKGKTVTVEGKSCALLQDGKDHVLTVDVLCEVVPII